VRAIVLVGGEGTRLRPLTETVPKPLLPLMDRASLDQVLDHLARHGVHEVVLSSPYLEETFRSFVRAREGDPAITWITETEPLGTGGAIVSAIAAFGTDEPFLALNGDILTDLDLTAMLAAHRDRGAAATIALTRVEDARPYGFVLMERDGRVREFREKPTEAVPGDVNAGTYVLEPSALTGWEAGVRCSIERDVFPAMIAAGRPVYGFASDAYWLDLGTPEKYLQAHVDILRGRVFLGSRYPTPFVADGAEVDPRARLGRWVVVGPRSRVGADVRIEDSVLHAEVVVEPGVSLDRSILGRGVRIGAGAVVEDSVLAEGAAVPAGSRLAGARVSAGRTWDPESLPGGAQPLG
jgi:mannose-1-phosphate guanylyltransferase